ncbi:MAG: RAMP superfamily CRISPR-associated protein [Clostridiales bacterium]|jgi:hypothetical protein|nr:RAMP superfamily CRISPR-associated protein [Clostridiales bacterium]
MTTDNKPYFFVPANQVKAIEKKKGTRSGRLQVTVKALTPLHFGAGTLGLVNDEFTHKLNRENDKIVLPGSSFKGALRSVFEALSESCLLTKTDNGKCTCPACSLFGFLGQRGHLGFSSFSLAGQPEMDFLRLPQLRGPNIVDEKQRKFYKHSDQYIRISNHYKNKPLNSALFECLPVNSQLQGIITYQDITSDQLGALLFSLGLGWDAPLHHKLGYAKPAYLGSVHLNIKPLDSLHSLIKRDSLSADELTESAKEYYEKHNSAINESVETIRKMWAFDEIRSDWHWKEDANGSLTY